MMESCTTKSTINHLTAMVSSSIFNYIPDLDKATMTTGNSGLEVDLEFVMSGLGSGDRELESLLYSRCVQSPCVRLL